MPDKHTESMSALRVQRDSHQRRNTRLETENRLLRKHQADIREWLATAIHDFVDARNDPDRVLAVADQIHQLAVAKLGDVHAVTAQIEAQP